MEQVVISLLPFFASFILEAFSHRFSNYAEEIIRSDAERFEESLTDNYITFANRAFGQIQMIYSYILTTVSGAAALVFNRGYPFLFAFLLVSQLGLVAWVYIRDPYEREADQFWKFPQSREALFGMVINLLFIGTILVIDVDFYRWLSEICNNA